MNRVTVRSCQNFNSLGSCCSIIIQGQSLLAFDCIVKTFDLQIFPVKIFACSIAVYCFNTETVKVQFFAKIERISAFTGKLKVFNINLYTFCVCKFCSICSKRVICTAVCSCSNISSTALCLMCCAAGIYICYKSDTFFCATVFCIVVICNIIPFVKASIISDDTADIFSAISCCLNFTSKGVTFYCILNVFPCL